MEIAFKDVTGTGDGVQGPGNNPTTQAPPGNPSGPAKPERKGGGANGRPRKGFDRFGNLLPGWELGEDGKARPKGQGPTQPPPTPKAAEQGPGRPPGGDLDAELDALRGEYAKAGPAPQGAGNAAAPVTSPSLISGYLFLVVLDGAFPALLVFLLKRFGKVQGVKVQDLRLTTEERKELEPVADQAARILVGTLDPVTLFLVSYAVITLAKIPASIPDER